MKSRIFVGVLVAVGILVLGTTASFAENPAREEVGAALSIRQPAPAARLPLPPQGVILYDNGPLITHPGGGAGGLDASALQTALGMNIYGFGHAISSSVRVADDFVVPAGESWRLETVVFFAYQTGAVPPTPTINNVNVQIWDGPPNDPASTVVFGDTTTNRLASSVWSNIYRVLDTDLLNTQRAIFRNTVTLGITLTEGTYWIDWQTGGTAASGPWVPPVTILGQTTTGNAMQQVSGAWAALTDVGPQGLPFILQGPDLQPTALAVDAAGNNVMDPGETVVVAPSWRNTGGGTVTGVTGAFSDFAGPAGGTYTISDAAANYGDIAAGATVACTSDCYGVAASGTPRPVQHWDTTILETLSTGATKTWTLHVGGSFTDVSTASPFYRFIETLLHKGVTGGCGADTYCPANSTTREQMAVFALISKEGAGYTPPACAPPNLFSDVPETSPFCRYIEELANRTVVSGCGPALYCPTNAVTREQMAIFVLRTLDAALDPPACTTPTMFADVPETSPFCRWIEELARRGVVAGCGGGNYCPSNPVTREQMGVFLAATFGLTLYGL